jgi:hypothetical protein
MEELEAVTLRPGPHLAAGSTMMPVVRMLAWLTANLAVLPGLRAVVWHPARCWSAPETFRTGVSRWIEGGPFPAFGLAALAEMPDDALQSEGLALFTGQELRIEPGLSLDRAAATSWLCGSFTGWSNPGELPNANWSTGPPAKKLSIEPSANGAFFCARPG